MRFDQETPANIFYWAIFHILFENFLLFWVRHEQELDFHAFCLEGANIIMLNKGAQGEPEEPIYELVSVNQRENCEFVTHIRNHIPYY